MVSFLLFWGFIKVLNSSTESSDGGPCLKSESDVIKNELKTQLQARVLASGAKIVSLNLNEISYAPEISQAMLKRQQAHAIVEARQAMVQGAVDISTEAVDELAELGHKMNPKVRKKRGKMRVCNAKIDQAKNCFKSSHYPVFGQGHTPGYYHGEPLSATNLFL